MATQIEKPGCVQRVEQALLENAAKAELPESAVFVFQSGDEWICGSNYEDGIPSLVYRDGHWFRRDPFEGGDRILLDGETEALACAQLFWTP